MEPRQAYTERLAARLEVVGQFEKIDVRISWTRLALAITAVALIWIAVGNPEFSRLWPTLTVASFIALLVFHDRLLRRKRRAERAAEYYQHGIERLDDDWIGKGTPGDAFLTDEHPYARDLDLFGQGSLFELISAARTPQGERTLAAWFTAGAAADEIRARQEAVDELRARVDLREKLAVLGDEVRKGKPAGTLSEWATYPPLLGGGAPRIAAAALALSMAPFAAIFGFTLMAMFLSETTGTPPPPEIPHGVYVAFLIVAAIEAVLALGYRRLVLLSAAMVEQPAQELALFADVLRCLEAEEFTSSKLAALRGRLETRGHPASHEITRLGRLTDLLDSRDNVAVRVVGPLLMWTTQVAFAVEAWRARVGSSVPGWLEAVAEFEALSSLAGYAYEHPDDPFPEIVADARFEAQSIGHPLLPETQSVHNNVKLDPQCQLWVVSGSNMSGKSTLLRTVGVNAVLALAGAPVRAASLRIGTLSIGASIRLNDSLRQGTSRFYAEITRIRQIMDLASSDHAVLFLLDELLHGTNSHDRRLGATGILNGLVVDRHAIGLATTHDLALTAVTGELRAHAANVHFQDEIVDGRIRFDYKLRGGVVKKSNALELMRAVGLDV